MATITATSTQQEGPALRKRLRVLQRAHSLTSMHTAGSSDSKILPIPDIKLKHADKAESPQSHTDYESRSESSEDDEEHSEGEEKYRRSPNLPPRPTINTTTLDRHGEDRSLMSPTTRAWYEFDLAVVVALVSPIGNWLTGGDHIKNLLLIILLIFYLHQIIEVPWKLYQKSRPHQRAGHVPSSSALEDPTSTEARCAQLATSELKKLEFFFLSLTFFSPFMGAVLLRYATAAVLGPDAVSWFSTGLFVLATGMRPWSHLIDRLSQRTEELQDFVHYPPATRGVHEDEYKSLEKRVVHLEKSLGKVKQKMAVTTEDIYDYVDDAVDAVEHAVRKQERKWHEYEEMVEQVGQAVGKLSSKSYRHKDSGLAAEISADLGTIRAFLQYIIQHLIPSWLLASPDQGYFNDKKLLGAQSNTKMHSLSPTRPSTPLETILEEDEQKRENVAQPISLLAIPYILTSKLVYGIGYIATAPLRAVVRMVLRNY
ncbi:hypothetical protein CPB84DRAFT_1784601 [Gymnopilus junonius]|uniref:Uncharacterized protein n=1 Tax=Gymnopilus junonius TaxID=109634 RepID=A0A9P5NKF4_GYMJU|nr:hypothetical protein CPB84DRAFT_1784601 [Gymnopilus junonius]